MKRRSILLMVIAILVLSVMVSACLAYSYTVYITKTGSCYHAYGCQYLRGSSIPISRTEAEEQGYRACSVCKP
jgi:hypothetical protein